MLVRYKKSNFKLKLLSAILETYLVLDPQDNFNSLANEQIYLYDDNVCTNYVDMHVHNHKLVLQGSMLT